MRTACGPFYTDILYSEPMRCAHYHFFIQAPNAHQRRRALHLNTGKHGELFQLSPVLRRDQHQAN